MTPFHGFLEHFLGPGALGADNKSADDSVTVELFTKRWNFLASTTLQRPSFYLRDLLLLPNSQRINSIDEVGQP